MASRATRQRLHLDRVAKCPTFKIGYLTRSQALDGCERAMDAGRVSPGCHLMPYECADCGQWHIRNQRIVQLPPEDASKHDYRSGMREKGGR